MPQGKKKQHDKLEAHLQVRLDFAMRLRLLLTRRPSSNDHLRQGNDAA
jgi:hypothetical protein